MSDVRAGDQPAPLGLAAPVQLDESGTGRTGGSGRPEVPASGASPRAGHQLHGDTGSGHPAAIFRPSASPDYGAAPKYDFSLTADTDSSAAELEEFYSYVEAPILQENRIAWEEWCAANGADASWTARTPQGRRKTLQHLLSQLDLRDAAARICASRALLYHLQGTFAETSSSSEQLDWISANAHTVLHLGGVDDIYAACKRASVKHDWATRLPDYVDWAGHASSAADTAAVLTPEAKAELVEEINVELTVHLAQLYSILETQRGDFLRDTLMVLDPPLPVFAIELTASLREKSIRGFPVKKLVLVLWKSILATLGGFEDVARCKLAAREREGLAPADKTAFRVPSRPEDMRHMLSDIAAKFPTLARPHLTTEGRRAEAFSTAAAILANTASEMGAAPPGSASSLGSDPLGADVGVPGGLITHVPPPSGPKPGKQKYQTDQSRPFVFPYSDGVREGAAPFSIHEALALYQQHMYIPTALSQQWRVRQDFLHGQGTHTDEQLAVLLSHVTTGAPPRSDAERLDWVDDIYRASLPSLQSAVIVLLKLALATMTSGHTNSAYSRAVADGVPIEDAPEPTLEDIDVSRHREILNKAISATLILLLKWFRASHAMKFEYLAQIMLDSNILLLVLKMFGLQEVAQVIRWRSEVPEFGLFGYSRRLAESSDIAPQDVLGETALRIGDVWGAKNPEGYSWRNMFALTNLTRILQRLTKGKVHRILLLVQYKSIAILKRSLKVPHDGLQLYVLKLIKSQVPFCGRKWRQSNMRIITLIYLHCRPGLRDDWLVGGDMDAEIEASLPEEQSLRRLVRHYNLSVFPPRGIPPNAEMDDSSASTYPYYTVRHNESEMPKEFPADNAAVFEREAFPLAQQHSSKKSAPGRYILDEGVEGYLDTYEEELNDLFASPTPIDLPEQADSHDWSTRVNALIGASDPPTDDSASEISSIASNDTAPPADLPAEESHDDNRNDWEHMSPREMKILSSSALGDHSGRLHRSKSTEWTQTSRFDRRVNSSPLERPIMHWNMEDLVEDALAVEERDEDLPEEVLGLPTEPLPSPKPGGIDEVEHIFGA
ncbi:Factor arrest protein 11 [Malassezia cuniculi]|uniref:Factor arrest protein 11 n=1 Tax=Malassezia cuniculi TaxID=948313 RepID=A0AAF0J4H0_9BASI|nr:Factor arrest protein 11 [Malassezia cuniculi]